MKPAISTVCSLNAPLETILEEYSAGQCHFIEVWLGHAEQYLDGKPVEAPVSYTHLTLPTILLV